MKIERAQVIVTSLADGTDPFTGSELPAESLLQHPEVIRALLAAAEAIKAAKARGQRRAALPTNVGKDWSDEEKVRLCTAYSSGVPIDVLATQHGRTRRAIQSRLILMGLLRKES